MTLATMILEIVGGLVFGSMALLADGLHMASHAVALGVAAFAYAYTRRHAGDPRFAFSTGKVNSLAGFSGAILLAAFAAIMVWESIERLIAPTAIKFDYAIGVAVVGLVVNGVSALILGGGGASHGDHGGSHADHTLRSAYLHVIADALTSVLAIVALFAGKLGGWVWLDPAMGLVGAALIVRWSIGLARETSAVLLDQQADPSVLADITTAIEGPGDARVCDLHVWSISPTQRIAVIGVMTSRIQDPAVYKRRLPQNLQLAHVTVEVNPDPKVENQSAGA